MRVAVDDLWEPIDLEAEVEMLGVWKVVALAWLIIRFEGVVEDVDSFRLLCYPALLQELISPRLEIAPDSFGVTLSMPVVIRQF